jgi:hypothetical protein
MQYDTFSMGSMTTEYKSPGKRKINRHVDPAISAKFLRLQPPSKEIGRRQSPIFSVGNIRSLSQQLSGAGRC